jgi:glyoxylase-like metal-dependent hydrolase (beta-lactamase superfamily II)
MAGLRELAPGAYHWQSGSNAGILVQEGQALIIDAGLDRSAAADIAQAVEKLGARPIALLITHAHADHSGGASFLARRAGDIPVLASPFEASIVRHPIWEPLYLYSGAAPIEELQHKFTLAKPCPVAQEMEPGMLEIGPFRLEIIPLYGHAVEQVGVVWGDVCYTADAFFPPDLVAKARHPVLRGPGRRPGGAGEAGIRRLPLVCARTRPGGTIAAGSHHCQPGAVTAHPGSVPGGHPGAGRAGGCPAVCGQRPGADHQPTGVIFAGPDDRAGRADLLSAGRLGGRGGFR